MALVKQKEATMGSACRKRMVSVGLAILGTVGTPQDFGAGWVWWR